MKPSKSLSIRLLAIPIFIEMFLRYLSLMINTYMVSIHNNDLVGAMGSGNLIDDLFITIFSFLSVGCSIVIAQAIGAKNYDLASDALHHSLFLNMILGLFCSIFIVFFADFLLSMMNVPSTQFIESSHYLKMLGISLLFDSIGIILSVVARIYNMAYFVSFSTLVMNVIIICINYYVLNYTNLELLGVGISTIIGRVFVVILLLYAVLYKINIKIYITKLFVIKKNVIKNILNIGAFSAGENLIWIVQYGIAFSFVNLLGKDNANVQTIYFQITLFMMLIGHAISLANEIIIGKLVGAKYLNIAYKHTWSILRVSLLASFIVSICIFFSKNLIMDTLELNTILKDIMLPLFTLSILLETGRTFNIVMVNSLRAAGDAKFPFIAALIFMLGLSLPLGYILCFKFNLGILGIWLGFCADEWVRGLVNAYRWKSCKWKNKAIV